jgi:hypothetical protein
MGTAKPVSPLASPENERTTSPCSDASAKGAGSANHFVPITPRHAGHAGCRCGLGSSIHSMSHGAKGAYTSAYRVRIR